MSKEFKTYLEEAQTTSDQEDMGDEKKYMGMGMKKYMAMEKEMKLKKMGMDKMKKYMDMGEEHMKEMAMDKKDEMKKYMAMKKKYMSMKLKEDE